MSAIDLLTPAHRGTMVGRLVRDDKDVDDLIADQLRELINAVCTPGLTANDLAMRIEVRAAIAEELLNRRAIIKATAGKVPA